MSLALRHPIGWRQVHSALLFGIFLTFVVTLSPHLVHHVGKADHDICLLAWGAEHTPSLTEDSAIIFTLIIAGSLLILPLPARTSASFRNKLQTRAPPTTLLPR